MIELYKLTELVQKWVGGKRARKCLTCRVAPNHASCVVESGSPAAWVCGHCLAQHREHLAPTKMGNRCCHPLIHGACIRLVQATLENSKIGGPRKLRTVNENKGHSRIQIQKRSQYL